MLLIFHTEILVEKYVNSVLFFLLFVCLALFPWVDPIEDGGGISCHLGASFPDKWPLKTSPHCIEKEQCLEARENSKWTPFLFLFLNRILTFDEEWNKLTRTKNHPSFELKVQITLSLTCTQMVKGIVKIYNSCSVKVCKKHLIFFFSYTLALALFLF